MLLSCLSGLSDEGRVEAPLRNGAAVAFVHGVLSSGETCGKTQRHLLAYAAGGRADHGKSRHLSSPIGRTYSAGHIVSAMWLTPEGAYAVDRVFDCAR